MGLRACELNAPGTPAKYSNKALAGEGNRTLVSSLEGYSFTIKLHPRRDAQIAVPDASCQVLFLATCQSNPSLLALPMTRIVLLFLFAGAISLQADLTIVQKVDMAGTPGEMTIKFQGDKVRVDPAPQLSIITDAKTGDTVTLMHGEKKAMRISGDKLKAAAEMMKTFSGATPAEQKSKLTPLGRKETVDGIPTDVYTTDTMLGKATYYIATNYPDAAAIIKEMKAAQPSAFANSGTSMPDFRDLPGVPVKIEMDTPQGHVVMTLVSARRDPIPNSVFAVPAGYTDMKLPDVLGGKKVPDQPGGPRVPGLPPTVPMPSATP